MSRMRFDIAKHFMPNPKVNQTQGNDLKSKSF